MFSYGKTDVGKWRKSNQDSFLIDRISASTLLAVVCDGMGGAAGGEVASSVACSEFANFVEDFLEKCAESSSEVTPRLCVRALHRGTDAANTAVFQRADEDPSLAGMGTTLVAALVVGERVYVVNVGDSRLYAIKDGSITQVTHDHSYVQMLVDQGRITEEEALHSANRNIITRAVGTSEQVESDVFVLHELPDAIILCSDGLTNMLSLDQILEKFKAGIDSEDALCDLCTALVDAANDAGGHDNITAAVVSFAPDDYSFDDDGQIPLELERPADISESDAAFGESAGQSEDSALDIVLADLQKLAEDVGRDSGESDSQTPGDASAK